MKRMYHQDCVETEKVNIRREERSVKWRVFDLTLWAIPT
jgi:hypothetical protein